MKISSSQLFNNNLDPSNLSPLNFKNCRPFLIISTPCGIGKYKFHKISYDKKNDLIFEYKIVDEDNSAITKIKHFIGNYYYLSALQLLYASNHKL